MIKIDIEAARTWRRPVGAYLALALIAFISLSITWFGEWTAESVALVGVLAGMWGWDNMMRSQERRVEISNARSSENS